jgi:hypothetical protein
MNSGWIANDEKYCDCDFGERELQNDIDEIQLQLEIERRDAGPDNTTDDEDALVQQYVEDLDQMFGPTGDGDNDNDDSNHDVAGELDRIEILNATEWSWSSDDDDGDWSRDRDDYDEYHRNYDKYLDYTKWDICRDNNIRYEGSGYDSEC